MRQLVRFTPIFVPIGLRLVPNKYTGESKYLARGLYARQLASEMLSGGRRAEAAEELRKSGERGSGRRRREERRVSDDRYDGLPIVKGRS